MAQLNLYVPDDVAAQLKQEARKAHLPLSRYLLSRLSTSADTGWPDGYFETACGFLHEEFPEPADRLPEAIELRES